MKGGNTDVVVVDASAALPWCFADEQTEHSQRLLDRLLTDRLHVPVIWTLECANALLAAERSGRITNAQFDESLMFLLKLNPSVDNPAQGLPHAVALSKIHRLTIYDATYLELALRIAAPLATRDGALKTAAQKSGVELVPC